MNNKLTNITLILKKLMSYQTTEDKKEEFEQLFNYIKSIIPKNLYITDYEFDGKKSVVISNTKSKKTRSYILYTYRCCTSGEIRMYRNCNSN